MEKTTTTETKSCCGTCECVNCGCNCQPNQCGCAQRGCGCASGKTKQAGLDR